MNAQELPKTAVAGALAIVTLPVRVGIAVAQRVSDSLGRGADAIEPEPKPAPAPAGAREPTKPTAAETEAVVGEQTDGIADAGPKRSRQP